MDKHLRGFRTFEDLEAYKLARQFRKNMYAVTRRLPKFEMFELGSQIRRAATSLTNNIAEGHGRYHIPDQLRFLLHARGSLEELIDDLNICLDESYLGGQEVETLKQEAWRAHHVLNGYGRYLRRKQDGEGNRLQEANASYNADPDSGAMEPEPF
jgi:four helix bundle protein